MYKLGRQPRGFNPGVPHYSALVNLPGALVPTPPKMVDYTKGMPNDFGMYYNDIVGNCTCASYYHMRQVWSFNANKVEKSEVPQDALRLYEQAANYNPRNPDSDKGASCQEILTFLHKTGAPIGDKGQYRDKILSFVEIDTRNEFDLHSALWQTGGLYIGFDVPRYILPQEGTPPSIWEIGNNNSEIIGGHCVALTGYTYDGYYSLISWGKRYLMSRDFFNRYVDEAYCIVDMNWFNAGHSILGMTIAQLIEQQRAL